MYEFEFFVCALNYEPWFMSMVIGKNNMKWINVYLYRMGLGVILDLKID